MKIADTHGVNHVNFALLDLFGYQFAPRYAQVGKVINDMFDVKEDKEHRIQLCLKKVHHGLPGKSFLIFMKKNSLSRKP